MGVVVSATGSYVSKAVTVAELVKRRCPVSAFTHVLSKAGHLTFTTSMGGVFSVIDMWGL